MRPPEQSGEHAAPATSSLVPAAIPARTSISPAISLGEQAPARAAKRLRSLWSPRRRGTCCIGLTRLASDGASIASAWQAEARRDRQDDGRDRRGSSSARGSHAPWQKGGDPRAHRIAHHIGRLNVEMVEKHASVLDHLLHGVGGRSWNFRCGHAPGCRRRRRRPPWSRSLPIAGKPNLPHGSRRTHE